MLHLRMIVPSARTAQVEALLTADRAVTHVIVLPGAARSPDGDVVFCDVVREGASIVLKQLRALGVDRDGSIVVDHVDTALSASADRAAHRAPGYGVDAVVWEEIEHVTGEETRLSAAYLIFLTVATVIAGIGVLLDQPILIVGAMVVGPEFGPSPPSASASSSGRPAADPPRHGGAARRASRRHASSPSPPPGDSTRRAWSRRSMLTAERPLTDFIWRPDALSWVVGFLAGVAGMLSLTSAKAGTLVGVLISVTTVPAAANAAVALAYGVPGEAAGSALQLIINVAAIIAAGVLTLLVQRTAWRRRSVSAVGLEVVGAGGGVVTIPSSSRTATLELVHDQWDVSPAPPGSAARVPGLAVGWAAARACPRTARARRARRCGPDRRRAAGPASARARSRRGRASGRVR